jgi:hypothetical protein
MSSRTTSGCPVRRHSGSPLALGDELILTPRPGGMALDRKTGKTLWKSGALNTGSQKKGRRPWTPPS